MTTEDFNALVMVIISEVRGKVSSKGSEYGREDRLHNFKKGARRRNKTPEEVLLDMQEKHSISIDDMITELESNPQTSWPVWLEKVTDRIVYDICLLALVKERIDALSSKDPELLPHIPVREFKRNETVAVRPTNKRRKS